MRLSASTPAGLEGIAKEISIDALTRRPLGETGAMTTPSAPNVPEVDVDDASGRSAAGAFLLDVRTADEWAAGHAPDSVWIPMDEVAGRRDEVPQGREIVVICRSGARSARVTAELLAAGHDAVNVVGGLQAWAAAGHPVVTDAGTPGQVA
jgi:rhodanese-related sulfurtransferase